MSIHHVDRHHPHASAWDAMADERRRRERELAADDAGTAIAQQLAAGALAFQPPAPRLLPPPTRAEPASAATSAVDRYTSEAQSMVRFAKANDLASARRALGVMPNNRAPAYSRAGIDVRIDDDLRPLLDSVDPTDESALTHALRALFEPGIAGTAEQY